MLIRVIAMTTSLMTTGVLFAAEQVITPRLHHLRQGPQREWDDFPAETDGSKLEVKFQSHANPGEWSLSIRQDDVRDIWKITLNGQEIGRLQQDENDMVTSVIVPPKAIQQGENTLNIEQTGKLTDDIRVGDIVLHDQSRNRHQSAGTVEIAVNDVTLEGSPRPIPCRLTIINEQGSLVPIGTKSNDQLAIRTGVIYTANGQARFALPAGNYTIFAGRGFEYGIDQAKVSVRAGEVMRQALSFRREVSTAGWVSCDTHIHTLTHSGHGDATLDERLITLAGEGIELPIATDHNIQIDYRPTAEKLGVAQYFTPVVGDEVTTSVGHFNVFPLSTSVPVPNFKVQGWKPLFDELLATGQQRVIILNHARDLHAKFRPFGPEHHIALTGENINGWDLKANAMEVINSGAQQSDPLQLSHDWMSLLNRGLSITPVGASDSHDVSRYIVGQGRTYIRCRDDQPGQLPVAEAIDNFRSGQVTVSCGLLTEITVNDGFGPGESASPVDDITVALRVLGPSWVTADKIGLYANGLKIKEAAITPTNAAGVKWSATWNLPRFRHDVHLVAIATGPGVTAPYWPTARPYQPTSTTVTRRVIGVTGAVWIDGDGDGKRSMARDYAERLNYKHDSNVEEFVADLENYDDAVAYQAASIIRKKQPLSKAAITASPAVKSAFQAYEEAWRASEIARAK